MYIIHCALLCILYSDSIQFLFSSQINKLKYLFQLSFNSVVRSLFNRFLIIVQYADPGNVFQVFCSCKELTITCNLESNNFNTGTFNSP
jgi:hypothetical protein